MNIFITGIDGCVGSHAAEYLREQGFSVFGSVFTRSPLSKDKEFFVDLRRERPFSGIDISSLDAVVHTAGIVDQNRPARELYAVNGEGTEKTLKWARRIGIKHFIHVSSTSVYGIRAMGQNRYEATPVSLGIPFVPYSAAKIRAEKAVRTGGVPYTILRMPAVIGASDAIFSGTIINAIEKDSLFRCGGGDKLVSTMCAGNIGAVVERVLFHDPCLEVYNCSDYHLPWNQLVDAYIKNIGAGSDVAVREKHPLSMAIHLKDKNYLLIASHSYFGAHYPNGKLLKDYSPEFPHTLDETVSAAVKNFSA